MQLTKAILALALVVSPILAAPTEVGEGSVNTNVEARAVSSSYSAYSIRHFRPYNAQEDG